MDEPTTKTRMAQRLRDVLEKVADGSDKEPLHVAAAQVRDELQMAQAIVAERGLPDSDVLEIATLLGDRRSLLHAIEEDREDREDDDEESWR